MELEHIIAVAAAVIVSIVLLWIVWRTLCSSKDDDNEDEGEKHGVEEKLTNAHLISWDQSRGRRNSLDEISEEEDSPYVFPKDGLADPFGVWAPKEKHHAALPSAYKTAYPKSPIVKPRTRKDVVLHL